MRGNCGRVVWMGAVFAWWTPCFWLFVFRHDKAGKFPVFEVMDDMVTPVPPRTALAAAGSLLPCSAPACDKNGSVPTTHTTQKHTTQRRSALVHLQLRAQTHYWEKRETVLVTLPPSH